MESSLPFGQRAEKILSILFILYVIALYGGTAAFHDGLFERDGYYHARFAQMMPERGLDRQFEWTQLSTWKDRFCDKEFLYHVFMMPFASVTSEPITGAKLFSVLLSVAVLAALYAVLRIHGVRWPLLFAFLPLAAGGLFIARLGMIRSHVLSMLLLMVGMHFLLKGRWKALLILGFVYAWSYTVPFVLFMTAVPFIIGLRIKGDLLDWKLPAAAAAGSIMGLAIHPYTPETLESILTYLQVFQIGIQGQHLSGIELGNEIYPYSLPVFFNIYPLIVVIMPLLAVFAYWRRSEISSASAGVLMTALFWTAMTLVSARFVEYSVLLMAIACGLIIRDTAGHDFGLRWLFELNKDVRRVMGYTVVAILLGLHVRSMQFYKNYHDDAAPPRRFTGAVSWMEKNIEPGEIVINLYWDDFPELFYDGSRQRYLWGLDPTYSIRFNYEKAFLLERFRRRQVPFDGKRLREEFDSRTLVLRVQRETGYPELAFPPFRKVYADNAAAVYVIDEVGIK